MIKRWSYIIGLIVFFLDRSTKYAALRYCLNGCDINQFLSFSVSFNRGVTWSLFHTSATFGFIAVTTMVIGITLGLSWYAYQQFLHKESIVGELLIIAGSCSNIIDRFIYGGVIDFIELSYNGWIWPSFNLADASIVMGVGIMIMAHYKKEST